MNRNMEAITWALHARGLSPTARVLLMELCAHVNSDRGDYAVWPSHKLLAESVEVSVATIKRHLKELVDTDYLSVRPGVRKDGGRSSNVYDLAVDSSHRMPRGRVVQTKAPPVQDDPSPIDQDELASPVTGERGWQATRDLCNEPLESRTSERKNTPLPLSGETPPRDLLGDIDTQANAITAARGSLIEYVADGWKKLVEEFPRIPPIRVMNDSRKKAIARRAAEVVQAAKGTVDAYQVWDTVFSAIRNDVWLRGDSAPRNGYSEAYVVKIDDVLRTGGNPNFLRILEKAATDDHNTRVTSDPRTGRRLGPAEQSGYAALALIRAARQQRTGG